MSDHHRRPSSSASPAASPTESEPPTLALKLFRAAMQKTQNKKETAGRRTSYFSGSTDASPVITPPPRAFTHRDSDDTLDNEDRRWDYQSRHQNPRFVGLEDDAGSLDLEKEGAWKDEEAAAENPRSPPVPPKDAPAAHGPPGGPPGGPAGHGPPGAGGPPKEKDPNLIEWDGPDDPDNPMNWSRKYRWALTVLLGCVTFIITFASSVFSTATVETAELFNVSIEVMTLGTSLFVLGFAFGPIVWGPFSELYGRKIPLFFGLFVFGIFNIPVAVAQNVYTILICRFIGGFFGSSPLAIVGGTLADFWNPIDRGVAICVFAGATFIGPVAGPIVGGFVAESSLGWRWTAYLTLIMGMVLVFLGVVFLPETFAPVILQRRAKKIRYETRNWAIHSAKDEQKVDFHNIAVRYLFRPFQMLLLEPILVLMTLYMSLIYGILYLFFEAFPISYQEERHWSPGLGALPFIGISIGAIIGILIIVYLTKTRFAEQIKKHGRIIPEERLPPMFVGAAILPAGLFWFAWTSSPNISWVPQAISGIPIGIGILIIFIQGFNYIIDVYLMNANSAIAANTLIRSFLGAGFPLFAMAMYHNLGVAWASTLLACLTTAMFPVPILFYIFGKKIRKLSKFSPNL